MKILKPILMLGVISCLTSGCAIRRAVNPIETGHAIGKLHLERNDRVKMKGMHPTLEEFLQGKGFAVETVAAKPTEPGSYSMTYTANWAWDVTMYLTYFKAAVFKGEQVIGNAEYDARRGIYNLGKFGSAKEKITPLLDQMFNQVKPVGR